MNAVSYRPLDPIIDPWIPVHTEMLLTVYTFSNILKSWIKSGILPFQDGMTKHILSRTGCIMPVNNVLDKSFPI